MKHIVFAVTNDLTHDRRMHRICASLATANYHVLLIGRKLKDSRPLHQLTFSQHRLTCLINSGPLFYMEYNVRLFFYLLFSKANVFGACDLDTALAVVLAGKLRKRKLVFDAHEHFAEVPEVERRPVIKGIWHAIGKWSIPKFQLRYTVGNELAAILTKTYGAPFHVIRNVPASAAGPIKPLEERERTIVYIGALNEGRGIVEAIEAMSMLPEFQLKLVGEGDLSTELRTLVTTLHLSDRVEFIGLVDPARVYDELSPAMIGLNLLESRSASYYYSLANKFFDYMHAGVPSVNMNFPEYQAILKTHSVGTCIDTLAPQHIADAVKALTANTEEMRAMIDRCTHAREAFSWEHESIKLLDLFRGL